MDYAPRVAGPDGFFARDIGGEWTRDTIEQWLARNAGDFQSIDDFEAALTYVERTCDGCGQVVRREVVIPWDSEDNEGIYLDCISGDF
jgi:hypothetical protein